MNIFEPVDEYRNQVIEVLKINNKYYDCSLTEHTTASKKYNIKYYRWNHPNQGSWEYEEIFTDPILDFCKKTFDSSSVVIDIGAQAGLMSVLYAQFAGKVISFEPNPVVFESLQKNAELYKNIIPYNVACSREEGNLVFHYSDAGYCNGGFASDCAQGVGVTGHTYPIDVYAINLNDFLRKYYAESIKHIRLIKVDTEGHDKEILKSLADIISRQHPLIIAEMYPGLIESEVVDLIETIQKQAYRIFDVTKDNSGLGIVSKRKEINSVRDVVVGRLCNFFCVPDAELTKKL